MDSMLGYFPYTLFQTLTRKGIWQEGAGTLSTAPRLVHERERTNQREQERANISTKKVASSTYPMPINLSK